MVVDNDKFEAVCESLSPVHVKIIGVYEHKIHGERIICTVKELTRYYFQNIPYMN